MMMCVSVCVVVGVGMCACVRLCVCVTCYHITVYRDSCVVSWYRGQV